ncbi:hypothetical protein [Spelaeicoccus albus]|uniref:Uncharacterized protein n=1 Tax=Spelaeicoccus albus TaxID=1280376 RepID=A0A7Z0A9J3_9MICO|nr:hypothetical protein [Spelaeicoccus albus]NYI66106.1 hypothetical protein [Spelaeicoccus albus]
MTSAITADVVHHLVNPGELLPFCGTVPGPNRKSGDWHTVHDRDLLLQCVDFGLCCCMTCLSPEALGGWTPLIMDDAHEQNESGVPDDQWWVD